MINKRDFIFRGSYLYEMYNCVELCGRCVSLISDDDFLPLPSISNYIETILGVKLGGRVMVWVNFKLWAKG